MKAPRTQIEGKPCPKCQGTLRYLVNGDCVACTKRAGARWRKRLGGETKEQRAAYLAEAERIVAERQRQHAAEQERIRRRAQAAWDLA